MTFFCLCMSPALDATVRLGAAPRGEGEVIKDVEETVAVGGKGLNVARWLAVRGAQVACGGLLGEDNANPFVRELAKYGVADRFIRVEGSTRHNEMLVWPGGSVKLNRVAFPDRDFRRTKTEALLRYAELCDVAIMSGGLPKGVSPTFYADAIRWLKERGVKTVLDASGEAMRLGVEARPDLIKPNAEECEPLVGFVPKTPDDFVRATGALRAKCGGVIISDGANGAWFDGVPVAAPQVRVLDTTAAGDTLLAEYCFRAFAEQDADAARRAVAAGSAACLMPGGEPPSASSVEEMFSRTTRRMKGSER